MFFSVAAALVLLFCGATFLEYLLERHPGWFVAYWSVCFSLTLLSILLACYDMASSRRRRDHEER